jgi:hypothetical protein
MPKKGVRLAKWRDILRREKLWQETIGLDLEAIVNFPVLHNGVAAAFKYFALEPKNPVHNRILLGILADVCFPRPSHKTKRWNDFYYVDLARCFEAIVRKHEGMSDREAAKRIQLKYRGFDHLTADALRRRLPEARKRIQRLKRQMAEPTGLGHQLANKTGRPF